MAKAIDIITDQVYISEIDEDEIKTEWLIRSMTAHEFMKCTSKGFVDHKMITEIGITGWTNFHDGKGNQIEFSVANIARIHPMMLQELSYKIQSISTLSGEERKNSVSQLELDKI